MTDYCRNCSKEQEVRAAYCGNAELMKCTVCNFWIRCMRCLAIRSVDHNCEEEVIQVPS